MKERAAAWLKGRDACEVAAAAFIAAITVLVLVNLSMFPVYLDIPYHMAVTRGFREAGGIVTWDFWDYAPQGRPHLYPPLLHVGMSLLEDIGLPAQATATAVCAAMFPFILLGLWWAMRKLFGSRAALYALVLAAVPYTFFYQSGITIAASLVLALTPMVFLMLEEDHRVAAAVLLAMCLYAHLVLGHLLALALFIYLLHRREAWRRVLAVLGAAYLLYLPWGIVVLSNLGSFSASEPGAGSGFSLHLLLWLPAIAGFALSYLRKKQYYLLPSYLLSMAPIALFYPHRFWDGHIFLPLAMLGGVALDRLHVFIGESLSRRAPEASHAGLMAGISLGALLLLVSFVDPVLASSPRNIVAAGTGGRPGAAAGSAAPEGMYPPYGGSSPYLRPGPESFSAYPPGAAQPPPRGGSRGFLPPGAGKVPARRPLQEWERTRSSLDLSLQPTTLAVLLALEDAPRHMLAEQEVFGEENMELMEALSRCSEPGDVVFAPDGRLGDLIYAVTGRYATQGMFHEVQPQEKAAPLQEADLAVIPVGAAAPFSGGVSGDGLTDLAARQGWEEVVRSGRFLILAREEATETEGGTAAAAVPMWAAYALLLAAVAAIVLDLAVGKPRGPVPGAGGAVPPRVPAGGGAGRDDAVIALVPARDEEKSVAGVVEDIRLHCPGMDILVIDDGSRDATGAVALEAGAMVLRLEQNLGVGEAERQGLSYAYRRGYAFAVRLDGDGQHPACGVADLLAPLRAGEADAVVGSRFLCKDGSRRAVPWVRRLGMAYFRVVIRLTTPFAVTDPTSGYRAYSRRAMRALTRCALPRYPEVASLRVLAAGGLVVREVAVEMRPRGHGSSTMGVREGLRMAAAVTLGILRAFPPPEARREDQPALVS